MFKNVVAVVVGCLVAGVAVMIVQSVGRVVYPPPPGLDPSDEEAFKEALAQVPAGAKLFVILAWAVGSLVGGFVASKLAIDSHLKYSLFVGGFMMMAGISMMTMIPSPIWFWILGILVFLPCAYLGSKLARPRNTPNTRNQKT